MVILRRVGCWKKRVSVSYCLRRVLYSLLIRVRLKLLLMMTIVIFLGMEIVLVFSER